MGRPQYMDRSAVYLRDSAIKFVRAGMMSRMCDVVQLLRSGRLSNQPAHKMTRAVPDEHLLMWSVAGRGFARSGDGETFTSPGTVIVLPVGQPHAYASDVDEPWDLMWIHFRGHAADQWVDRFGQRFGISAELGGGSILADAFTELITTHQGIRPGARLADFLCWALLGRIEHRLELGDGAPADQHAETLIRVQRFIEAHLDQPLTVEQLAAVAHLSPRHLTRLCRSAWQSAPMAYVIRQRLARASLLLTETSMPVAHIATHVGFSDPYHFSRLFRRHIGQSPTALRRDAQKPQSTRPSASGRGD